MVRLTDTPDMTLDVYRKTTIQQTTRTTEAWDSAVTEKKLSLNPIALRKAKIVYNFGLSECNRVKG